MEADKETRRQGDREGTSPGQPVTTSSSRVIRASELAQYAYCAKAWWLGSVMGLRTTNTRALERGEATHRLHGQHVWWSRVLIWIAVGFVVVALLLITIVAR